MNIDSNRVGVVRSMEGVEVPPRYSRLVRCALLSFCLLWVGLTTACGNFQQEANADDSETTENADGEDSKSDKKSKRRGGKEGDEEEDVEEAIPVETVALGTGPIEAFLRLSTNLEAERDVQVFSQAARQVRRLYVEEGARVGKGQLLLQLQDEEQRNALAKTKSQLQKAVREYERQQRLFEQELISEQVFTDASYDKEQLELALADAERELTYTEVRAPINGTITQRMINVGDYVNINQHLFDLVDFDTIVARIYVPEKELPRLRAGLAARIFSDALGTEAFEGKLERISPVVDPKSGTIKVTVAVPQASKLRTGMYVTVELVTDVREEALLVPKKALVYDNEQVFVFRVDDEERVERLLLRPVLEDRDYIEPQGGVAVGDRIVVAGQAGLKGGVLVREIGAEVAAGEAS